jgi:uncharacterized protein (TIGR02466 family)
MTEAGLSNRTRHVLFPTLLTSMDLEFPEASELRAEILALEQRLPTFSRGEKTSWQSDDRLFERVRSGDALGSMLSRALAKALPEVRFQDVMLSAWANVLRAGDYFTPHTHSESAWSGTYYLDAGESDAGSGVLMVRDPRAGAGMVTTPINEFDSACTFELPPHTGLFVVFPSWLTHWVTPYRGTAPRISIAFNAR